MKKLNLFLLLVSVILFSESFKPAPTQPSAPSVSAKIDGIKFDLKNSKYVARLNEANKTAVLTFFGNDVIDKQGKAHQQKLHVEYVLSDAGVATVKGVVLEYNKQKFMSLPNESAFNVSKIVWSSDKKSFVMNAGFDTKVQKEKTTEDYDVVLGIQGSLENIKVDVAADSDMAVISE